MPLRHWNGESWLWENDQRDPCERTEDHFSEDEDTELAWWPYN
jgi:hypothetical protein